MFKWHSVQGRSTNRGIVVSVVFNTFCLPLIVCLLVRHPTKVTSILLFIVHLCMVLCRLGECSELAFPLCLDGKEVPGVGVGHGK